VSLVDRTDPTLKRAAIFVLAYPIVDVIATIVLQGVACATCTPGQLAIHKGVLIAGFSSDAALVVFAYFGSRGRTVPFVAALVVLCFRLALAVWNADYLMTLVDVVFIYIAAVGTLRCVALNRKAAIRAAISRLAAAETEETPSAAFTSRGDAPPSR
jgi:hypothetical protein